MTKQARVVELNKERANRGSDMIDEYRHTYEEWATDQEILTDILADLLHCTSQQTLNFEWCLEMARVHFKAEMTGEDQ